MDKLMQAIQEWPAIVQGALGAALFTALLYIGQKLATLCSDWVAKLSLNNKRFRLLNQYFRYRQSQTNEVQAAGSFSSIVWYRASRSLVKGLIWLVFGFIFAEITAVLGLVGYVGALYYLFKALNVVGDVKYHGDLDARISEIEAEVKALDAARKTKGTAIE